MIWFNIPEGYSCIVRSNDTTLLGYQGSRRDTFTLNGLIWQKTSTSTNSSLPSNSVCVSGAQIPASVVPFAILGAVLVVLCFLAFINKMIRRVYL